MELGSLLQQEQLRESQRYMGDRPEQRKRKRGRRRRAREYWMEEQGLKN